MTKQYDGKTLKILAIGNSFSDDAMKYLYDIMKQNGAEDIILGNLYYGGGSLQMHVDCAKENLTKYMYLKNMDGQWVNAKAEATLLDGITDENWDIITFQQASYDSGICASYDNTLTYLVNFVTEHMTNKDCRFLWHMTWAYGSKCTYEPFGENYNSDQNKMYEMITDTVKQKILTNPVFKMIIPAGTTIQNLRTSFIGDTLNRDDVHLNDLGKYVAGLTWYGILNGTEVDDTKGVPKDIFLSEIHRKAILEAVNASLREMFKVTQSTYTKA